jgi:hypothetical protein
VLHILRGVYWFASSGTPGQTGLPTLADIRQMALPETVGYLIPLPRFDPSPEPGDIVLTTRVTVLAAAGAQDPHTRYVTEGTFADGSGDILVRVVSDRDTGVCSLYVLTENPMARQHVLVVITGAGNEKTVVVTDLNGKAHLKPDTPVDWESVTVAVQMPRVILPITSPLEEQGDIEHRDVRLKIGRDDESLTMQFEALAGEPITSVVTLSESGATLYTLLTSNKVTMPFAQASGIREVRLFA